MSNLNEMQAAFVGRMMAHGELVRAAREAGYGGLHIDKTASRLMRNPKIVEALKPVVEVLEPLDTERSSGDRCLDRLWDIANFDMAEVSTFDGKEFKFKPFKDWPKDMSKAVIGVTTKELKDGTIFTEFKFESKLRAIEKIGQYEGMWMGFDQLIAGLKAYGIELVRDGDKFMVKQDRD